MPNDVTTVASRAVRDLSVKWDQLGYVDEPTFVAATIELATEVTVDQQPRIGATWTLDTPVLFQAAIFETMSRLMYQVLNQYYSAVLSTESITLGPITLSQQRNEMVSKDILANAQLWHVRAESKLVAGGAQGRRAALRNWIPQCRIVVV